MGNRLPARVIRKAGPCVNFGVAIYTIEATGSLVGEPLLEGAVFDTTLRAGKNNCSGWSQPYYHPTNLTQRIAQINMKLLA